jgi:hypothetical protein
MTAKRWIGVAVSFLLLSSFLLSQSLVEIAQKEKERRAALKGKKTVVVTNADLAKVRRKPAVESAASPPAEAPKESVPVAPPAPPAPAEPKPAEPPVSDGSPPAPVPLPAGVQELQERWNKAKEYVELLTLKMGALWQEFNGVRDPIAKEGVRQAITETYAKLQTAQEEETKARQEFEKALGDAKKESAPSIWVR